MQLDANIINLLLCGTHYIRHWRDLTKQQDPVARREIHASHKTIKIRTKGIKIRLRRAEVTEDFAKFYQSEDYLEKHTNTTVKSPNFYFIFK